MTFESKPHKFKIKEQLIPKSKPMVRSPSLHDKTTLMFLRMSQQTVFIPVHLSPVTYANLVNTIREKFSELKDKKVFNIVDNIAVQTRRSQTRPL